MVMLVEQLRVLVECPNELIMGALVERRRRHQSEKLRVIPMKLLVRGLERGDDRALASEVHKELEYRVRLLVGCSGSGRHAYRMPKSGVERSDCGVVNMLSGWVVIAAAFNACVD
jgi:hypothetical protein